MVPQSIQNEIRNAPRTVSTASLARWHSISEVSVRKYRKMGPVEALIIPNKTIDTRRIDADPTTLEGRLELLKDLAYNAPDAVKHAAIKTLEEITNRLGEGVGPPAPMTDEERIERLVRLMNAVGPEITRQAYERQKESQATEVRTGDAERDTRSGPDDSDRGEQGETGEATGKMAEETA